MFVVRAHSPEMFIFPAPSSSRLTSSTAPCVTPCVALGVKAISPHVTRVHVAYVQVSSIDETQPKQGFVKSPTSRGWFHWLARGKPHSRAHPTPLPPQCLSERGAAQEVFASVDGECELAGSGSLSRQLVSGTD